MTALQLKVEGFKGNEAAHTAWQSEVARMIKSIDSQLDFLAWELRAPRLDQYGLTVAVETYVGEWSENFGVAAEFQTVGFAGVRLPPEAEMSLYRIVQEALNNTAKYAAASRAGVLLERRDGEAVLVVEDDGRGFDPKEVAAQEGGKKLGLVGIRERAALAGGGAVVESAPGKGTMVIVRVPIPAVES